MEAINNNLSLEQCDSTSWPPGVYKPPPFKSVILLSSWTSHIISRNADLADALRDFFLDTECISRTVSHASLGQFTPLLPYNWFATVCCYLCPPVGQYGLS